MQKRVILATLMGGLMALPCSWAVAQTTLIVDDDGAGTATDCNASDPAFTTIQAAVDAAAIVDPNIPGDTILVCPGTYSTGEVGGARVNIPKNSLTIVSIHGPHVTRISGAFQYGFLINAHRVTIQGFKVVGGEPLGRNIGIYVYGGHENKVLGNNVRGALTLGICIGSNFNIVDGNIVHHSNDGIVLGNDTDPTGPFVGCEVHAGEHNIITHNTVIHNGSTGLLVYNSSRNSLVANNIKDNGTGIAIRQPTNTGIAEGTFVQANKVHDNTTGIEEQGFRTRCHGNNIQDNVIDFDPPGACATADNQLDYIQLR